MLIIITYLLLEFIPDQNQDSTTTNEIKKKKNLQVNLHFTFLLVVHSVLQVPIVSFLYPFLLAPHFEHHFSVSQDCISSQKNKINHIVNPVFANKNKKVHILDCYVFVFLLLFCLSYISCLSVHFHLTFTMSPHQCIYQLH